MASVLPPTRAWGPQATTLGSWLGEPHAPPGGDSCGWVGEHPQEGPYQDGISLGERLEVCLGGTGGSRSCVWQTWEQLEVSTGGLGGTTDIPHETSVSSSHLFPGAPGQTFPDPPLQLGCAYQVGVGGGGRSSWQAPALVRGAEEHCGNRHPVPSTVCFPRRGRAASLQGPRGCCREGPRLEPTPPFVGARGGEAPAQEHRAARP